MSSKPATATSRGTESPCSRMARIAPIAIMSFAAKIAVGRTDRKSTRLNSSHPSISYAVFCLKKKKKKQENKQHTDQKDQLHQLVQNERLISVLTLKLAELLRRRRESRACLELVL